MTQHACKSDLVDISGALHHQTQNAFLLFDGIRQVWLPKSMVEYDGTGIFTMPEWLAKDKELI